ncbi:hypothetical protein SAMN05660297_03320 [Natronincola peptidivorans]|uniref:Uncharacterized protein n=1 Tax=Natronincola peptidivorans TaxID=426128 RepID=A0A1I0GR84_9FIRM|nr:hypothetical protein [Natronincola peptidivorans]SET73550.1 hypothetical protein SAMN05660297_03320 [Natronincola peptidivorans]
MEIIVEGSTNSLKRCIITTGVSSLNYYNNYMQQYNRQKEALYNCMGINSIRNIGEAQQYDVIIDVSDNNVTDIVFELFNHLLPKKVDIYVKLIHDTSSSDDNIKACIVLLQRLERNRLIELEIINKIPQSFKEKEEKSWMKRIKNLFFFIGPGNTGKTSIISALTELCNEKGGSIGLIDLTESCKLMNYFPNVRSLEKKPFRNGSSKKKLKSKHDGRVDVYYASHSILKDSKDRKDLTKTIEALTDAYDYVFINADLKVLNHAGDLFRLGEKIFIVHDFMPTKINVTKHILLTFAEKGINNNPNIALIYNKIIRCSYSLKNIEEKMIFKTSKNKELIPLVDLNSKTFEIPYHTKTMRAIINHISTKSSIVHNAAYSYKKNIDYLYKYINNISYVELEDMDIIEGFKACVGGIKQHQYAQRTYHSFHKHITSLVTLAQSIKYFDTPKNLQKY